MGDIEAKVSGINCTIPTVWKASRLRSTVSSAFVLSDHEKAVEEETEPKFKQNPKLQSHARRRLRKRTIPLRKRKKEHGTSIGSHNSRKESNMIINLSKKRDSEYTRLEVRLLLVV